MFRPGYSWPPYMPQYDLSNWGKRASTCERIRVRINFLSYRNLFLYLTRVRLYIFIAFLIVPVKLIFSVRLFCYATTFFTETSPRVDRSLWQREEICSRRSIFLLGISGDSHKGSTTYAFCNYPGYCEKKYTLDFWFWRIIKNSTTFIHFLNTALEWNEVHILGVWNVFSHMPCVSCNSVWIKNFLTKIRRYHTFTLMHK